MRFPHRTTVLAALIGILAIAVMTPAATYAGDGAVMHVDGTGDCAGQVPCHTSIQQAVRLVTAVDTEIRVFPGTYNETVDFDDTADNTGGTYGDLVVISVNAKNVETPGAIVDGGADSAFFNEDEFNADLRIDGFTVRSATNGIFVVGSGMVTIESVNTSAVAGDGINVTAAGDILVDDAFANRSVPVKGSPDGFDLEGEGDITVVNSQSTSHNGPDDSNGIEIEAHGGEVLISNVIANDNSGFGIAVESEGGEVTVRASGVVGNAYNGLNVTSDAPVLVEFVGAVTNVDDGMDITSLDDVDIENSYARNNAASGIEVATDGDLTIRNVTVEDNNRPPVRVSQQGNPGAIEIRPHPSAPEPSTDSVSITGSAIYNNAGDGILIVGPDGLPANITSNAICQNTAAGLAILANTVATATNNWWGDSSGPTHDGNPGGTGDEIVYDKTGGGGDVIYDPWIQMVEGEVLAPPALTNEPADIAFMFTGEGGAELDHGLGWPAEFELVTDNGVLDTEVPGQDADVSVQGEIIGGVLSAILTAESPGTANIDLEGPCGLSTELAVAVEAGLLFGDVDCNGAVDTVDALKINRHVAGLEVTQTEPCPDIGSNLARLRNLARLGPAGVFVLFGDLDCDSSITPIDALAVLRHVAGLPPLSVPKSCPDIG